MRLVRRAEIAGILQDVAKLDKLRGGSIGEIIMRDVDRRVRQVVSGTRACQRSAGGCQRERQAFAQPRWSRSAGRNHGRRYEE